MDGVLALLGAALIVVGAIYALRERPHDTTPSVDLDSLDAEIAEFLAAKKETRDRDVS